MLLLGEFVRRGHLPAVESKHGVRLPDFPDIPKPSLGGIALSYDGRREPALASPASFGQFDEGMRLDPTRVAFDPKPPPVRRASPRGPIDSLILHLLPLLLMIS